eukprot:TRINITY_DN8343_c0_g1_i1.p1 TRINITY_DN8343_c0_g1~~TRINITY_DN8343_c0_g1_i1.p1  ORF type:complete len:289 (+),score=71.25 TRINITY_DN8343_c0_g1_i1:48-914(+)
MLRPGPTAKAVRRRFGGANAQREHRADATSAEWFAAASRGDVDALTRLLESIAVGARDHVAFRAAVNSVDICGRSALYIAAERGDLKAVQLLLSVGSDPDLRMPSGSTPLLAAIELPAVGAGIDVGAASASDVSDAIVSKLLFLGADAKRPEYLLAAAERGRICTVRALLRAGADPAARRRMVVAPTYPRPPAVGGAGGTGMQSARGLVVSKSARTLAQEQGWSEVADLLGTRERHREIVYFLQWQRRSEGPPSALRLPQANQREIAAFVLVHPSPHTLPHTQAAPSP